MKKVIKIDVSTGLYIEDVIVPDDYIADGANIITIDPPQGLHIPKWTGTKWVEGKSKEEIEAIKNQPIQKSEIEILREDSALLMMQLAETQFENQKLITDQATLVMELMTKGVI